METKDIALLAVTLIILGEVSYLLARLPKTSIKSKDRAILVDTSVLMDGRIVSVAATGFIGGTLVIPRSVVGELQLLADGSDSDKRARARFGLDVVSSLQKLDTVETEILQDGTRASEGVDDRLLTLAKRHHAVICTLDFNLNKVAVVEGIQVLNLNELAQGLRMSHLPGDQIVLDLVQKGQDAHQAVGYLSDGTMVVVEQANAYIGKSVNVEVIRSLQTAAGKMMFAKRIDDKRGSGHDHGKSTHAHRPTNGTHTVERKPEVSKRSQGRKAPSEPSVRQSRPVKRQEHSVAPRQPKVQASVSTPVQQPPVSAAQSTQSQQPQQRVAPRRNRRKTDREAALIALVNKQE